MCYATRTPMECEGPRPVRPEAVKIARGRERRNERLRNQTKRVASVFLKIAMILATVVFLSLLIYDLAHSAPINAPADDDCECQLIARLTFQKDGGLKLDYEEGQDYLGPKATRPIIKKKRSFDSEYAYVKK